MSAANPSEALSWAFMRAHPEDAARALETLPPADVVALMQELPARITARVLQHVRPSLAAAVLHGVDRNRGSALLAMLETSMAARVLRQVTEERRITLLSQLRTAKGMALRLILAVPDNSIGAWVDADCISLTGDVTAEEARQRATSASGNVERIVLLDERQSPIAWVALHDLLRAKPDTPVSQLAVPLPAVLVAAMPLSAGLLHPAWRSTSVLPVTTRLGTFIGLLRHERLQQIYEQDAASRGATISSAGGALAQGYFQCVTAVLRGGLTVLPKVRALSEIPDER
jgi:Mg/Co/Ni transporter MgtE